MESVGMMGSPIKRRDSEEEMKSKEDSPDSPQSGKFSQDEEFTDPDDPVTVVKTALHIDKVTLEEERERKLKQRELEVKLEEEKKRVTFEQKQA